MQMLEFHTSLQDDKLTNWFIPHINWFGMFKLTVCSLLNQHKLEQQQ